MIEKVNVIPLINTSYNTFTKSEKKVADIVLKNPKEALYTSITDLAEHCEVGETTVLRFCRKLGFTGYQSFKMTLAQSIQSEGDVDDQLTDEITNEDSLIDVCKKVMNTNIAAINETFDLINYEALEVAIDYMVNAKRIVFFGAGASAITAHEAKNKFMRIVPYVDFTYDSHTQAMVASLMSEDEVAIAFSYSGSTKDTAEVLKTARNVGAKTICITRFAKSPITQYSDVVLLSGAKEGPLQGGALSTKMAQLYLVDILYAEYFRRNIEKSRLNKEKTAEAISDKLY
ncbi:MurR/RpiR family transcriptional regulator [Clostridium swellfunianum]|uniref:MurR/RpiR family transcriptional regulator n=1 Tax=Clostridium swellfunianum TaxID=1367462 RepID=UPI002030B038|nr:MurR/RpiR family transcriptional regulator [Clostridium swellfunianum]MCM0649881.1 MurR/RpiR family transcriptional regulator [Clostridium swellfunianum]